MSTVQGAIICDSPHEPVCSNFLDLSRDDLIAELLQSRRDVLSLQTKLTVIGSESHLVEQAIVSSDKTKLNLDVLGHEQI